MALKTFGMIAAAAILASANAQSSAVSSGTPTTGSVLPVSSPTWLASVSAATGLPSSVPTGAIPTGALPSSVAFNASAYPEGWKTPPTDSPEVQAVISALDWSKVPNATVHKAKANGDLDMTGYNENTDPYCWWSDTNCVQPKVDYLPQDISFCPRTGDWGLTYDDGPFNPEDPSNPGASPWAEPNLYNFLAAHNQKATLFYIGSNVIGFPAAAQRAISDGLTICVHTWSHPQMTSMTNDQVVAEFYWTLRAIKEAAGITPRCWRPPYGDVDDRVRAIAWQMGMRTIIWDEDTNDWNMPGDGGGNLPPSTVDGYFQGWIDSYKNGTDNQHGHIVLEHELNNATVSMAEKWLPQLQETFNVVPVHECMNISNPYWEENFVYPTEDNSTAPSTAASSALSTAPGATAQSASSSGSSGSNDNSNSNSDASESSTSSSTSAANASYNLAFGSMVFTAVVAVCFF